MKVRDILEASEALNKLVNLPLKTKVAYELSKLIDTVNKTVVTAQNIKTKLISKFGDYDSDGKLIIPDRNLEEINRKLYEYYESEINISFNPVSINDLPEQTDLTAYDFFKLKNILKE